MIWLLLEPLCFCMEMNIIDVTNVKAESLVLNEKLLFSADNRQ